MTWIVWQSPIYRYDRSISLECTTFHDWSCKTLDWWAISSSSIFAGCCCSPKDCSVNMLIMHLCSDIHCHYHHVSPTQCVLCQRMFCNLIIMVDLHIWLVIHDVLKDSYGIMVLMECSITDHDLVTCLNPTFVSE